MNELILSSDLQQLITADQAWHYQLVPGTLTADGTLTLLVAEEAAKGDLQMELEMVLGRRVNLELREQNQIRKALNQYYRKSGSSEAIGITGGNDGFLYKLLQEGKTLGASDIHIEIYRDLSRLRLRIDGVLIERHRLKIADYPALVNTIKIKAQLDITEKRLPQDGRINVTLEDRKYDIRVSVLPTLYGEKIVMRYLGSDTNSIDLSKLGFSTKQQENYLKAVRKPNGIILISGPTGSGKTTTLYATLKLLNEEKRNIVTIEDPIEYTLDGINQVQLKEGIGLNFGAALRSFLRQDPDIIMIGEIRDKDTAEMAIRASLTGHLVFSTIHTNSAWGTVDRLTDMGVPAYLLASTLNMSIAQRLLRKLCTHCKNKVENPEEILQEINATEHKLSSDLYEKMGCEECFYTGYKGRIAIYEMIPMDSELSAAVKSRQTEPSKLLQSKNIRSLGDQARDLLFSGITSLEEIYPIVLESAQ